MERRPGLIAAVMTVRDEVDIIAACIEHHAAEGVDRFYIVDHGSTDGTSAVLADLKGRFDMRVTRDDRPHHHQPEVTSLLARQAFGDFALFVVAVDADEFFISTRRDERLCDTLRRQPEHVRKCYARSYRHLDPWRREEVPRPHPKVAFRPSPLVHVWNGNHDVDIEGYAWGEIEVREWQYRSLDHFRAKVRKQLATLDPALRLDDATHVRRYGAMTDEELEAEWVKLSTVPSVRDPIPSLCSSLVTDLS